MSRDHPIAATSGPKRPGTGEYVFDLANVNHVLGGPGYSTSSGACMEGDRMIIGLMRLPAGTGAVLHSHPNEQWIYILEGTYTGVVEDKSIEAKPGSVIYVPANVLHSGGATKDGDVLFFTCKDSSYGMHGIRAG
jgi:mannose-6-phosphate isomerase-like protein (cupin superfamily)